MRNILKIHNLKAELELSTLKHSLEKAVREGVVFRVCGDMPSTSDGGQVHWHPLTASRLWAKLNTDNGHRLMEWHRGRCRHHKTEWLPSVFRGALPDKDFYDRPLTHRLNSIHRKEQCRNDGPFRSTSLRHTSFFIGAAPIPIFQCFNPSPPPSGRRRFMFSRPFIRGSLFNKAYHQQVGQYELLALT